MPWPRPTWCTDDLTVLDERCPLPLTEPFTRVQAERLGVSRSTLGRLVAQGLVREVLRGVYVATQVPDSVSLRAEALSLVVTDRKVVTDRTAAWLHGVPILPRSAVVELPPVQVFDRGTSRVRRAGVDSGVRDLPDRDVTLVGGVLVTTPLRTALDLGRLLRRYDAIAALDGFLRIGLDRDRLISEVPRFRGARGVVQLRALAPLADGRAESPPESALRLHWIDGGLPEPEPQVWVEETFRIDLALPRLRFGAEYQGERFHADPEARARDRRRREWLEARGWTIVEVWRADLYGPGADPVPLLRRGIVEARQRLGSWRPPGRAV